MKPWYTSKTFWFNALFLVGSVAAYFGYAEFKPEASVVELAGVLVAVINIVLRFVTKKPIV